MSTFDAHVKHLLANEQPYEVTSGISRERPPSLDDIVYRTFGAEGSFGDTKIDETHD